MMPRIECQTQRLFGLYRRTHALKPGEQYLVSSSVRKNPNGTLSSENIRVGLPSIETEKMKARRLKIGKRSQAIHSSSKILMKPDPSNPDQMIEFNPRTDIAVWRHTYDSIAEIETGVRPKFMSAVNKRDDLISKAIEKYGAGRKQWPNDIRVQIHNASQQANRLHRDLHQMRFPRPEVYSGEDGEQVNAFSKRKKPGLIRARRIFTYNPYEDSRRVEETLAHRAKGEPEIESSDLTELDAL